MYVYAPAGVPVVVMVGLPVGGILSPAFRGEVSVVEGRLLGRVRGIVVVHVPVTVPVTRALCPCY